VLRIIGVFAAIVSLFFSAGVTRAANANGTSTLRLTSSIAPQGNYIVTITGTGPSSTHSTTVNLRLSKH